MLDRRKLLIGGAASASIMLAPSRSLGYAPGPKTGYLVFRREQDGQISQFVGTISLQVDASHIRLDVAASHYLPGGTVYLPGGHASWHDCPDGDAARIAPRMFRCEDHPRFCEDDWFTTQVACASSVWQKETAHLYQPPMRYWNTRFPLRRGEGRA